MSWTCPCLPVIGACVVVSHCGVLQSCSTYHFSCVRIQWTLGPERIEATLFIHSIIQWLASLPANYWMFVLLAIWMSALQQHCGIPLMLHKQHIRVVPRKCRVLSSSEPKARLQAKGVPPLVGGVWGPPPRKNWDLRLYLVHSGDIWSQVWHLFAVKKYHFLNAVLEMGLTAVPLRFLKFSSKPSVLWSCVDSSVQLSFKENNSKRHSDQNMHWSPLMLVKWYIQPWPVSVSWKTAK